MKTKKTRFLFAISVVILTFVLCFTLFPKASITTGIGIVSISLDNQALAAGEISLEEPYNINEEIIEQRTRNSKTYYIGNDKYSWDGTIGAVHYKDNPKDEKELWKDIDTTIQHDGTVTTAPYDLQVYLTDMPGFHYTSKELGEFDIRLDKAYEPTSAISSVVEPNNTKPIIKDNQVIWNDFYPDVDIILTASNTRVALQRLIKSEDAPLEYDVKITEVVKGVATLLPLKPALDATLQQIVMEEKSIDGGRNEKLKLEVLTEEGQIAKPIAYPILDSTVVDEQVGASTDDCYRDYVGVFAEFVVAGNFVRAGYSNVNHVGYGSGLRFINVNIPASSTIDSSNLILTSYGNFPETTVNSRLRAELNVAPVTFSDAANFDARTWTSDGTHVHWNNIEAMETNIEYTSPDFAPVIQEVADLGAITHLVVLWDDWEQLSDQENNHGRVAWSFDGSAAKAPQLVITFTAGSTPEITNSQATWNIGAIDPDEVKYFSADNTQDDDYAMITNTGDVDVDIEIQGTDIEGGAYDWTLASSAGNQQYCLYANSESTPTTYDIEIKSSSYNNLIEDLAVSATYDWSMKFTAPTDFNGSDAGANKTGTVTLVASEHV